ncbi:MAG: hypothetical protein ABSH56_23495 [Bryobacteraceae bacterium]
MFAGAESFAPKESKPAPLPEWARKAAESLSIPESTVHPTVMTLAHGVKLIVQPESISDTISSSLNVGRTRGFYSIVYGCDPENVSKARAMVEKDLKDL